MSNDEQTKNPAIETITVTAPAHPPQTCSRGCEGVGPMTHDEIQAALKRSRKRFSTVSKTLGLASQLAVDVKTLVTEIERMRGALTSDEQQQLTWHERRRAVAAEAERDQLRARVAELEAERNQR